MATKRLSVIEQALLQTIRNQGWVEYPVTYEPKAMKALLDYGLVQKVLTPSQRGYRYTLTRKAGA